MTTFREYVFGFKVSKPSFSWETKRLLARLSVVWLITLGIVFSLPSSLTFFWSSYWFMLFWIGIPPLVLYIKYCEKKQFGELD